MTEQQLFIAAVIALWGAAALLVRMLVGYMEKALESCSQERAVYLALMQGILEEISRNLQEHTVYSKQHTIQHTELLSVLRKDRE